MSYVIHNVATARMYLEDSWENKTLLKIKPKEEQVNSRLSTWRKWFKLLMTKMFSTKTNWIDSTDSQPTTKKVRFIDLPVDSDIDSTDLETGMMYLSVPAVRISLQHMRFHSVILQFPGSLKKETKFSW